jgi:hypothetical protein
MNTGLGVRRLTKIGRHRRRWDEAEAEAEAEAVDRGCHVPWSRKVAVNQAGERTRGVKASLACRPPYGRKLGHGRMVFLLLWPERSAAPLPSKGHLQ